MRSNTLTRVSNNPGAVQWSEPGNHGSPKRFTLDEVDSRYAGFKSAVIRRLSGGWISNGEGKARFLAVLGITD